MIAASAWYTPRITDARELAARIRSVSVLPAAVLGILLGARPLPAYALSATSLSR